VRPGQQAAAIRLLLAIGGDVALPRPSWVSYAAQAALAGARPHFVPAPPGQGGIPDPGALAAAAGAAAAAGRPIRSVLVTLGDNPTGQVPSPATVAALCEVAAARGLIIICDEIYRDLIHDPATPVLSPAQAAPEQTVITTGLSKNLALGGWRIGVARMPAGPLGRRLRKALLGAGSQIWPAPCAPVQHAAALGFTEPPPITSRVTASRALHAHVAAAVAAVCANAGLIVPPPQAGFYVYPDFEPWRDHLQDQYQVTTSAALARLLLDRYGAATLPAAPSANPPPRCDSGSPPPCSTATPPSSNKQPSPPPAPPRSRGSPPRSPGSATSSPTWPAQPRAPPGKRAEPADLAVPRT
jgi:aspartate aminotransferase